MKTQQYIKTVASLLRSTGFNARADYIHNCVILKNVSDEKLVRIQEIYPQVAFK